VYRLRQERRPDGRSRGKAQPVAAAGGGVAEAARHGPGCGRLRVHGRASRAARAGETYHGAGSGRRGGLDPGADHAAAAGRDGADRADRPGAAGIRQPAAAAGRRRRDQPRGRRRSHRWGPGVVGPAGGPRRRDRLRSGPGRRRAVPAAAGRGHGDAGGPCRQRVRVPRRRRPVAVGPRRRPALQPARGGAGRPPAAGRPAGSTATPSRLPTPISACWSRPRARAPTSR